MIIYSKKKRRIKASGLLYRLEKLGRNNLLKLLQNKPGSKGYKKIENNLKKAGLKISPEAFQVTTYIVPLIVVIILILVTYTNAVSTLMNIEKIKLVAEKLGKPELAKVDFKVNWTFVLISALLANLFPYGVVKVLIGFKSALCEKEVMMLQTYTIMMLQAGKPVKPILASLYERSKGFRESLELAVATFSADPNEALQELKESSPSEQFQKICIALEQTLNNDREVSLKYLENHRILGKELSKQLRIRKNTKKKIIGLLLMIIPLLTLGMIGFYPWLTFTLKQIDNVPI